MHKIKTSLKGDKKLVVYVKPTIAKAKKEEWLVHRGGKVFKAKRKKTEWKVKGKIQRRPDIGLPGRGKKLITIKRHGALRKYGYGIHKSTEERRKALKKAVSEYGAPTVFKMLQAQSIFRKRTDGVGKLFESDRDYVLSLMTEKEKLSMTKPARTKWMKMTPKERAIAMPGGKI